MVQSYKINMKILTRRLILIPIFLFSLVVNSIYASLPAAAISSSVLTNAPLTTSLNIMLKKAMPAVVNVYVQGELPPTSNPYAPGPRFQDVGSGVIIDAGQGYIVTNAHVVRYGQTIVITLSDGRRFRGKVLGLDIPSDIAVVKINEDKLSTLSIADSDKVQVGDFVVAIGNPFGLLNQSVTSGVVSALNRSDLGIEGYENFIQTDASINPGNSGGALVNTKGELVGINTAIIAPAGGNVGIGFAIPSNMVKSVADQLIKYGKVERGVLGVYVQDLTPDLADALNDRGVKGALITQVNPGSPAANAGLQAKDIVEEINGRPIENGAQLRNTIGLTRLGSSITLKVLRGNNTHTVTATLVAKEKAFAPPTTSFLAGVRLRDFDELDFNAREVKGVQVLDLDISSSAALKGMRPGDVILTANNQPVTKVSQLMTIAASNQKRLLLEIQRPSSGGSIFMVIDNN
jgi:serine protease Do